MRRSLFRIESPGRREEQKPEVFRHNRDAFNPSLRKLQTCAGLLATSFAFTAISHTSRADIVYAQDFADGGGDYEESDDDGNSPIPFEYDDGAWSLEGDDSGPTNYWLTSPEIAVANTAGLQVSFGHRYSIEAEWDGLTLEVSINGSDFQQVPGASFSQNGYDFEGLIGNHSLRGGEGFNGDSEGYFDDELITSIASVGGIGAGGTIQVRFLGAFDEGARGEGIPNWEIASVSIDTLDDEDSDGMPDVYEEANGLDPAVDDAAGDLDGDTVSNVTEYLARTNPQSSDTDSDDLNDNVETNTGVWVSATDTGTDPLSSDSDGDTLPDGVETNTGTFVSASDTGTDPNKEDSDGDNFADALEINNGSDPTDPESLPAVPTYELLDDLIGGDLTDPEDDGDPGAGADDTSWNWASIESNDKPGFGAENAYNVFNNSTGGKWCCTGATEDAPLQLTVEFTLPIALTHFTISSANDVPDRDPRDWKILGSNDGETFAPIYERADDLSLWQEAGDEFSPPRNTAIRVTLPQAAPLFRFIRYEVTRTANANHQIGELEYFGTIDASDSDADGMPDAWEEIYGLAIGTDDSALDGDEDGLTNKQEYDAGTSPNDDDSDNDMLKDGVETGTGTFVDATNTGTDPLSDDSDGDGLIDGVETGTGTFVDATNTGTDPNKIDSDGDTISDRREINAGSDPTDPASVPQPPVGGLIAYWDFNDASNSDEATDLVGGHSGEVTAEYSDDAGGRTGSGGDYAMNFAAGGSVLITEVDFLDDIGAVDQMTVSFWQKTEGTPNASSFWITADGFDRAAQAHVPWSNGQIYFDTAGGCCAAGSQRLNFIPADQEGLEGFDFLDDEWHHYAFVKDTELKQVWVDGILAFETEGGDPLPVDGYIDLSIGSANNGGNPSASVIDDFAIYAVPLVAEQILELAEGGTPGGGGSLPFQIIGVTRVDGSNAEVTWQSKAGKTYSIDYTADLLENGWVEGTDGYEAAADGDSTTYEDSTLAPEIKERYYRIREE